MDIFLNNTHNTEVIKKYRDERENNSDNNNNCKSKEDCPIGLIRNLKNIVYQITILPNKNVKDEKFYIRILSVRWKLKYNNHIHFFSHERLRNQTA